LSAGSDLICVASEAARAAAMAHGISAHRLLVTGIPVDLRVAQLIAQVRESDTRGTRQTQILICGGGHGLGPMETVVHALLEAGVDATLAIVCGHNNALQQRLNALRPAPRSRTTLRVIGFTDQMPALMASSDLMIGKPGGLTAAEARAAGLPLLVLDPIPGQEERNARILIAAGAARPLPNPRLAGEVVQVLLSDPPALAAMRAAAESAARPHAAHEIARAVLAQASQLAVRSPNHAMEDCAQAQC
jgi:UDP-N-acetylglucosamine:LPS N-acetylglucosamine transferase